MLTEDQWGLLWKTEDGRRFRAHLALMFIAAPPYSPPGESDYRSYRWHLRDLARMPAGTERLVAAMEDAARYATKFRPSTGAVRAQFEAQLRHEEKQRRRLANDLQLAALEHKPTPMTPEQQAEIAADLREIRASCAALMAEQEERRRRHEGPTSLLAGIERRVRNWMAGSP